MIDRQPPRLSVGVISAGAVGVAVAESFLRAGHMVSGIVAPSERSRALSTERIPTVPLVDVATASQAALVILAVPDPMLPDVVEQVSLTTRDGQMVAHTSGSNGCAVLQPVTDTGAIPLALHPAMTFVRQPRDVDRLTGCAWGVTSDSEIGETLAHMIVTSLGGVPISVPEERRGAYHAAMAHAGNHAGAVVALSLIHI